MTMKFKESMKITLPAIVIFFSCVAYGQTQHATSEQLIGLRQTVETELPSPAEPQKIDLGKIGVVVTGFRPEVSFDKPLTKGEASSQSAKQGAVYGANQMPSGLFFGALSRLFLMGVGAGVGAIAGSIKGESEGKIKETENTLNSYLTSVDFQGTLRDRLVAVSGEQTRNSCVPLDLKGPGTQGEEVTYDVSSYQDIDTILEVGVGWCRLFRGQNKDVNPDLLLYMGGTIRFISAKDGKILYTREIAYTGNTHKFLDWGADNARLLKEEMEHAFPSLAGKIMEVTSFLQEHPPAEPSEGTETE
jgi:hypothetical protein